MNINTKESTDTTDNGTHPREIFSKFTATMWQVVDELLFLEECHKKRRPGAPVYTTPSTFYLAGKCGCTRFTISRATEALVALGVLHKQFRRAIHGNFQTCLYRISNKYRWRINRVKQAISSVTSRVRLSAHKQAKAIKTTVNTVADAPKRTQPPPEWRRLLEKLRGGS